ncbi:glycosyltransferase family 2 protein [Candidatus Parcubacteria bacterium]|nr:MAG: glycosyltransferase family 2 protein [Candidatus Parcubacteria bacterium]
MISNFLDKIFKRYPRKTSRILEIILPSISVFMITVSFWGSILFPVHLAYFIIFFDVYWLYKSINLAIYSFISSKRIKEAESIDWSQNCKNLPNFSKVYHIVVIPNYQEKIEKLKETIDTIKQQTIGPKKIFVFVAMEEREENVKEKAKELAKYYKEKFAGIFFTFHPDIPGELKGKSSNQAYAGKKAYEILIKQKKLDIDYLTISSVDADTIFDKQYYAYLTYKFLKSEKPHTRFWQSANVSYNNFWDVPAFTRVISFFGSLWRASLLTQGLRLIPNSTYSLSFKLLTEIDYWDTDVIPEDYRIFFKAFFRKKGQVDVEPIYLKTSMDAPLSQTYYKSLLNKYHQERRWSWGISDDAVYLKWWLTVRDVPFFKKTYLITNVLMDHILWPVNWYIITISANIVALLNPVFSMTTLGYNLSRLSGFILTMCLLALFILIFIDFNLRSKQKKKVSKFRQFLFPLEFVFMPVAGFFLSSLPALISHLQLIIGKRMEYKVTEKV